MYSYPSSCARFIHNILAAIVMLVGWSQLGLGQGGDKMLSQRFLMEAPARWEEYAQLSRELQGVISVSHTGTINNGYQNQARLEYKTNARAAVLITAAKSNRDGKIEQVEEVYGYNSNYVFSLYRNSPDTPWVLTTYFERGNGTDLGKVAARIDDYLIAATHGIRLEKELLSEVVRQPGFRIRKCHQVQQDGEDLVEVNFTYSKMDGNWKRNLNGTLLFAPNQYWCWRSGNIQVTGDLSGGTLKLVGTQTDQGQQLPPLTRVWEQDGDWTSQGGEHNNQQRIHHEVNLSQPAQSPEDWEFTLSAFGLPEPAGVTWERPTPVYVWLLAAAGGLAVLALVFRWLFKRRQAAPAAA